MASFAEALYKGAEKVETESSFFVSVDFFHSEQLVREHMHGSFDWTCDMTCKSLFSFWRQSRNVLT